MDACWRRCMRRFQTAMLCRTIAQPSSQHWALPINQDAWWWFRLVSNWWRHCQRCTHVFTQATSVEAVEESYFQLGASWRVDL